MIIPTSNYASIFTRYQRAIICFLICFGTTTVKGQQNFLQFQTYTTEQGLSDNLVTCAKSDHHGFMWIGTTDGLNRFDGRQFFVFKKIDNDSTSLPGNSISSIVVDNDSTVWIGTSASGLSSYNRNQVKPYNGNGVSNMKKRAEEIGGTFNIRSAFGSGTSIEVIV